MAIHGAPSRLAFFTCSIVCLAHQCFILCSCVLAWPNAIALPTCGILWRVCCCRQSARYIANLFQEAAGLSREIYIRNITATDLIDLRITLAYVRSEILQHAFRQKEEDEDEEGFEDGTV